MTSKTTFDLVFVFLQFLTINVWITTSKKFEYWIVFHLPMLESTKESNLQQKKIFI